MLNHRKIQRPAIIHHLPRELCRGDRFSIIGNAHDPRFLHGRDFGNRFAFAPHRRRPNRPHTNAAGNLRAIQNEPRDGSIVVRRLRIRHAADRREPAARRRSRACFDGFRRLLSRLAQVHVDIDKAGSDDQAAGVKNFRVSRRGNFPSRPNFLYLLPIQQNVESCVRLGCRVDHAPVLNQ